MLNLFGLLKLVQQVQIQIKRVGAEWPKTKDPIVKPSYVLWQCIFNLVKIKLKFLSISFSYVLEIFALRSVVLDIVARALVFFKFLLSTQCNFTWIRIKMLIIVVW